MHDVVSELDAAIGLHEQAITSLRTLRARLSAPAEPVVVYVDQDDIEQHRKVTRRAYLEAARRGEFEVEKLGRQVRARLAVIDAWLASRRRRPAPRLVVDNDIAAVDAALEEAAQRFARGR